ncbi:hypothetical protein T484DRAFT_1762980, partial [Baffinella frigidus]
MQRGPPHFKLEPGEQDPQDPAVAARIEELSKELSKVEGPGTYWASVPRQIILTPLAVAYLVFNVTPLTVAYLVFNVVLPNIPAIQNDPPTAATIALIGIILIIVKNDPPTAATIALIGTVLII